jgi:hypothetical protein
MFKICSLCDFEWHTKDGLECPACNDLTTVVSNTEKERPQGGAFGTSKNYLKQKKWYAAVGITALILIFYAFILT